MRCACCDVEVRASESTCPSCNGDPLLSGRYRLEEEIGRGAHGTVYRAVDTHNSRVLAVKALPLRSGLDPKQEEMFRREASVLRQLSHRCIPRYDNEQVAGTGRFRTLYLLQEFVEGVPLSKEMDNHRYTETEVRDVLLDVADTLAYLHGLSPPVIHRDIKPSNLIRRPDGGLSLIDFGAVRDVIRDSGFGGSTVAGTFGYMAPEQFMGEASPASDIFGLGMTALRLLTREDPAALHDRTGEMRWEDALPASSTLRPLLRQMLHPDPTQRIQNAEALLAQLTDPSPAPAPVYARNPIPSLNAAPVLKHASRPDPNDLWEPEPNAPVQPYQDAKPASIRRAIPMLLLMCMATFGLFMSGFLFFNLSPQPQLSQPAILAEEVTMTATQTPLVLVDAPTPTSINPDLLVRIDPVSPVNEMRAAGLQEASCDFVYQIHADGSTTVLGISEVGTCIPQAYQNGQDALSRWEHAPPAEPIQKSVTFTFRVND